MVQPAIKNCTNNSSALVVFEIVRYCQDDLVEAAISALVSINDREVLKNFGNIVKICDDFTLSSLACNLWRFEPEPDKVLNIYT